MHLAQERDDEEAFKKIGQRSFWQQLNYVTGKKRTRSATLVQVEEQSGLVSESTSKDMVEAAIFREVHDKQYTLAKQVPICSGRLFGDFGYVANTPASKAVLEGTYQAPLNLDIAMRELFNKIAAIRRIIPRDLAPITITIEQWKRYWAIVMKRHCHQKQGYTSDTTLSGAIWI
jgi:hypothetical protein